MDNCCLHCYHPQVQVFLLQIQLAKTALEQTRQRSWKIFQAQSRTKQVVSLAKMTAAQEAPPRSHRGSAAAAPALAPGDTTTANPSMAGVIDIMYRSSSQATTGRHQAGRSSTAATAALLGPLEERAVQQEMVNFVLNLHQSVIDRLLLNAWVGLERVRRHWGAG